MKINNRGLTLIEVLLAMSLSAILATALYGLLWTGVGAWQRVRRRAELYQTARVVFERIETDLQNEVPLNGGALKELFPFEGAQRRLAFPTALQVVDAAQASHERRAVGEVTYAWKNAENGRPAQLVRNWALLIPESSKDIQGRGSEAFPASVAAVSFGYPSHQNPPALPLIVWDGHWEELHKVPEAVRIDLTLKEPESGEELMLEKIVQIWQGRIRVKPESST